MLEDEEKLRLKPWFIVKKPISFDYLHTTAVSTNVI